MHQGATYSFMLICVGRNDTPTCRHTHRCVCTELAQRAWSKIRKGLCLCFKRETEMVCLDLQHS